MTNDNVEQLTYEETEEIAMELGYLLIQITAQFCNEVGLSMDDPNTQQLIRVTLTSLLQTLPTSPAKPEAQA